MPNDFVFDSSVQPVYTQMTNTYQTPGTIAPPDAGAAIAGSQYNATATTSATLGILGGSVIVTLQIANPSGSGKTLYVSQISGGTGILLSLLSSFSSTLTLIKGGTLSSPSTVTPVNGNFASANTSAMTARSSASAPTGGTTFLTLPLVAGQFDMEQTGRLVVPPNQTLTVSLSAALSVAGTLSTNLNITWWEG
ncbi:hypothetical protein D7Z26_24060 [Cohnella endophytica]|uniref:Uncharacterized protein n=1 Tax=Cohnella endophytica TaxID=2419778 RepID=A0A494XA66_9BACL|nr:hypothetical protein [Cohnella endophytica]RKP47370.1 hypothetical protein D7Z26_24060 [Cohnella endophytica]